MNGEWIRCLLLSAIGAYALLGSILNWDMLIRSPRAGKVTRVFGEKGARMIYGVIGAFLLLLGVIDLILLLFSPP